MQVKVVKPLTFFYQSTQTTIKELGDYVDVVARDLYKEAANHDILVTGPIYWQYIGFDGKDDTQFTLEIALPVEGQKPDYQGKFAFKKASEYKCLSALHEGAWQEIPQTYGQLFDYIGRHRLRPSGTNREVYLNFNFQEPASNVTEIQIGLA